MGWGMASIHSHSATRRSTMARGPGLETPETKGELVVGRYEGVATLPGVWPAIARCTSAGASATRGRGGHRCVSGDQVPKHDQKEGIHV